MTRLTVSLPEELNAFIRTKTARYKNRSGVVRQALALMRKLELIREMQEHFKSAGPDMPGPAYDRAILETYRDMPEY